LTPWNKMCSDWPDKSPEPQESAMPRELDDFSADELLLELRATEERDLDGEEPEAEAPLAEPEEEEDALELDPELRDFEMDAIAAALLDKPEGHIRRHDRKDIFRINDADLLRDADCVVALFEKANVQETVMAPPRSSPRASSRPLGCATASPSASSR
jgi:hypothetical protein